MDLGTELGSPTVASPTVAPLKRSSSMTNHHVEIPPRQKLFVGNLETDLTNDMCTRWLRDHHYEVPIPLNVVQLGL